MDAAESALFGGFLLLGAQLGSWMVFNLAVMIGFAFTLGSMSEMY